MSRNSQKAGGLKVKIFLRLSCLPFSLQHCPIFSSHIFSVALRFKEDKFSCTLAESNELISFEKNLMAAGRRTLRGGGRTAFLPLVGRLFSRFTGQIVAP